MIGSFSFLRRRRFGLEFVETWVEISTVVVVLLTTLVVVVDVVVVLRLRARICVVFDSGNLVDAVVGEKTSSESMSVKDDDSEVLDIV
jgi:hypothetical protein